MVVMATGLSIAIIALGIQLGTSHVRRLESRRNNWEARLSVDFEKPATFRTSFAPIVSRTHSVRFTLNAPLQGELERYRGKEAELPAELVRASLSEKKFTLFWQVASMGEIQGEGTIQTSDLGGWAMQDHAHYQYACGLPELSVEKAYTFVARIEQADPAVNALDPVLLVRTWGSLKGHSLSGVWRAWHSVVFSLLGLLLFLGAYRRHIGGRKPDHRS
jgi:hypothetical protein